MTGHSIFLISVGLTGLLMLAETFPLSQNGWQKGPGCSQDLAATVGFCKLLYLSSCYSKLFPSGPPARDVSVANASSPPECTTNVSDNCLRYYYYYFFSWTDCFGAHRRLSHGISSGNALGLLSAGSCL